jgi:hypothetical protein
MVITITRWSDRFLIQFTNKMSVSNFQAKVRSHKWCYGVNINELAHQLNSIGDLFTFNDRRRGRKRSPTRAADIWGRRGRGATGHVSRSGLFFFFFFLNNTCSSLIRSSIAGVYRILCVSDSEHASRPLTCQSICRQHCTIYSFLFDLILKSSFVNWTVDISTVSILTSIITFKMTFIAAFSQWFKKNLWFKLIYIDYLEIFQFILSFYFLVLV